MRQVSERILSASSPTKVLAHLTGWAARHGMTHAAIGHVPPPGAAQPEPFFLTNWPEAWTELYLARSVAREDPVLARARRDPAPFTWAEMANDLAQWQPEGSGQDALDMARAFGWTNGLVVPVHGLGGAVGVVSLAGQGRLEAAEARMELQTMAIVAYLRLVALRERTQGDAPARLSPREGRVLGLLAEGMTDAQVALALGITERTVLAHVASAKARLGAVTRAQAVAIAVRQGLIWPEVRG